MVTVGPPLRDVARGITYSKPRWRGWMHLVAFECALVLGTIVISTARGTWQTIDASIYAGSVAALFGISALYHRGHWRAGTSARLQRLDHIAIVLLIAGSATTPLQVCLGGRWRVAALAILWSLTLAVIATRLLWMDAPERVVGGMYIGLGWLTAATIPVVWIHSGPAPALLLLGGGLLYTIGAVSYHRRRPDPAPHAFGYHEVFHAYVVAAAACQYVAIVIFLL